MLPLFYNRKRLCSLLIFSSVYLSAMVQASEFDFNFFDGEVTEELIKQAQLTNVLPQGRTLVQIKVNEDNKGEHWVEIDKVNGEHTLCLSAKLQPLMAIKTQYFTAKQQWHCLTDTDEFIAFSYSSSSQSVSIHVPQEYQIDYNRHWLPEEHWSHGDNTSFINYKLNLANNYTNNDHDVSYNSLLSGGGTLGTVHAFVGGSLNQDDQQLSDAYLFRDIGSQSRLTVGSISAAGNFGGTSLNSIMGGSLTTVTAMKPPSLRHYTQQFTGVANSNASIVFFNETGTQVAIENVPAGPYSISLGQLPNGRLTVEVDEAGSGVKNYVVYNRNTDFLLSNGSYEFNALAGVDEERHLPVTAGEWRYGLSETYTAGAAWVASDDYQQLTVSGAANLNQYGITSVALSTISSRWNADHLTTPVRFQFDYRNEIIKDVILNTFLQTSPHGYLNYTDLNAARAEVNGSLIDPMVTRIKKSEYNINLSTNLTQDIGLSLRVYGEHFLDKHKRTGVGIYSSYQTRLWSTPVNFSLSVDSRQEDSLYQSYNDQSITLSMSIPFSDTANTTFSLNSGKDHSNANAYYSAHDGDINYQVGVGTDSDNNTRASGYARYKRGWGAVSGDVSVDNTTTRVGASLEGSLVFVNEQPVLTSWFRPPVAIIDMNGASGVTLGGNMSNSQGIVVANLAAYTPTQLSVDVENLPTNTYVSAQTINLLAREGAIIRTNMSGVRQGRNILLTLSPAPDLATPVVDTAGKEYGWVSENGELYLAAFPFAEVTLSAGAYQFTVPEQDVAIEGLQIMALIPSAKQDSKADDVHAGEMNVHLDSVSANDNNNDTVDSSDTSITAAGSAPYKPIGGDVAVDVIDVNDLNDDSGVIDFIADAAGVASAEHNTNAWEPSRETRPVFVNAPPDPTPSFKPPVAMIDIDGASSEGILGSHVPAAEGTVLATGPREFIVPEQGVADADLHAMNGYILAIVIAIAMMMFMVGIFIVKSIR